MTASSTTAANKPRVELPTSSQLVPLLALLFGVAVTALSYTSDWLELAYQLPRMHAVIDTTIAIVSFFLAYLVYGRLEALGRRRDYMLAYTFGFSGMVNLYAAINQGISADPLGQTEVWTTLIGHLVVAILIAAAALTPDSPTRRETDASRFTALVLVGFIGFVIVALLAAPHLPWSMELSVSPDASKPLFVGPRLMLIAQATIAVAYAIAAWSFSRRRDERDDLMTWLASSCLLFALASIDYLAFPSIFSDWIYVGDILRLGGVLLLLVGAAREITRYRTERATMEERRRVARDLHDGVAQELAYIATIARLFERDPKPQYARRLADAAQHALDESRLVIATLAGAGNPSEQLALTARDAAHRYDIEPVLEIPERLDLQPGLTEALLRIVREAVTNAGRHSRGSVVTVSVDTSDGFALEVHDDGDGFDVTQTPAGFGLTGHARTSRSHRREVHGFTRTDGRINSQSGVPMTIRVLIADDHAQLRSIVGELLTDAGFDVVAQGATADAAVALALEHKPDVSLLDIRMPGDGISAARRIAAELPGARILMLTVSADSDDVLDALQAGAQGYILKGTSPEGIVDAVRAVYEGSGVIAPAVAPAVLQEIRRSRDRHLRTPDGGSVQLTEREWDILNALDRGDSTSQIAESLFVAEVTVRSHINALTKKLQVSDREEAVALFRSRRPASVENGSTL